MTTTTLPEGTPASIAEALLAPHDLEEVVVGKHVSWKGQIFETGQLDVTTPDGKPGLRDLVWHHGGAGVLALRDGRMCLVRQWRVALNRLTLEIPAGKIDPDEDPALCAARELAEETGLVAERLDHIADSAGAPGFTNEMTRIFWAHGLSQSPAHPDSDEFVDVCWIAPADIVEGARVGVIQDAKTIIAAYAALLGER